MTLPNKPGIYKIVVATIGTYYGITSNLNRRYIRHWKQLNSKRHRNIKMRRLVCDLGIEVFQFIVIDSGDHLKEAKVRQNIEMHFIKNDIDALNIKGMEHIYCTDKSLPLKDKYKERRLYLQYRTKVIKIYYNDVLIGIELSKNKIRSGNYYSDEYANITKVK